MTGALKKTGINENFNLNYLNSPNMKILPKIFRGREIRDFRISPKGEKRPGYRYSLLKCTSLDRNVISSGHLIRSRWDFRISPRGIKPKVPAIVAKMHIVGQEFDLFRAFDEIEM